MVMRRPYGERKCSENNWDPMAEWEVRRDSRVRDRGVLLGVRGLARVWGGMTVSQRGFEFLNPFLNMSALWNDKHLANFAISSITDCQQCLQIWLARSFKCVVLKRQQYQVFRQSAGEFKHFWQAETLAVMILKTLASFACMFSCK